MAQVKMFIVVFDFTPLIGLTGEHLDVTVGKRIIAVTISDFMSNEPVDTNHRRDVSNWPLDHLPDSLSQMSILN